MRVAGQILNCSIVVHAISCGDKYMKNYNDLIKRLNEYSERNQMHGGISAEAADAIKQLQDERDGLLTFIDGDCEHCAKQWECDYYKEFVFPSPQECKWEWDEDY